MAASVRTTLVQFGTIINEDPGSAPAGKTLSSVYRSDDSFMLSSTTTPVCVARFFTYATTLSTPTGYTIDLTNGQGTNGTITASGMRVQGIRVRLSSLASGNVVIGGGSAQAWTLPSTIVVNPGGMFQQYYHDYGSTDITSANKNIQVTGPTNIQPEVDIYCG